MQTKILRGVELAEYNLQQVALKLKDYTAKGHRAAALATILIGNDEASKLYVAHKRNAASRIGMLSIHHELDDSISQAQLVELIQKLNDDITIDGILIQLPLPKHIDTHAIHALVDPSKDVDGFHPMNAGLLFLGHSPFLTPCTAKGALELLKAHSIDLQGKDVCLIGCSNIVGKPLGALLLREHATPTFCHKQTHELKVHTKMADIVISAAGKANLIQAEDVKQGAVVVDIGINRLANGKVVGDVNFEEMLGWASAVTPVPGGVGAMTIAMLMLNTLMAYEKHVMSF